MSIDEITPQEWDEIFKKGREDRLCNNRDPKEVPYAPHPDPVNHPSHYRQGRVEAIEIIRQALNGAKTLVSGQSLYLWGNVLKYILRWPHKNKVEDLRKARVYLDWLIKEETNVE